MNPIFAELIKTLDEKYKRLITMQPVTISTVPTDAPTGGVYLFSQNSIPLYVGRTKLNIRDRVKQHVNSTKDCPFAFRLAREATGNSEAKYAGKGTRKDLLENEEFRSAYKEAKRQIKTMELRYVEETNPTKQALLEIYVATTTKSKHNTFETS